MNYLSICSGIEAATAAWHPLGWQPVAFTEIEAFPAAVLAHHWPAVPNLGDMTRFREWPADLLTRVDVLVAGTPCQAFSVAGQRRSLEDARGNLTLLLIQLYDHITALRHAAGRPAPVLVWENVPGVLHTRDNAFGCFLGGLAGGHGALRPPGGKRARWLHAGYVRGPRRAIAWRVLDAQYFGLAQRRERVFLVAGAGDGFHPEAVLFESEGLRRDSAPRREKGEEVAGTLSARTAGGGGLGTDFDLSGGVLPEVADTLRSGSTSAKAHNKVNGTDRMTLLPEVAGSLPTHHTPHGHGCAGVNNQAVQAGHVIPELRHPSFLERPSHCPVCGRKAWVNRAPHGAEAEYECDSCGWPRAGAREPLPFDTTQITSAANRSQPKPGAPCHPLSAGAHPPAVAFPEYLSGTQCASTPDLCPSLQSQNPTAVAFQPRIARNGRGDMGDLVNALQAQSGATGKGDAAPCVAVDFQNGITRADLCGCLDAAQSKGNRGQGVLENYAVRRLTPRECERLQGFPDDHTLIPWRGKPAAQCPDGPRYKALGNSMAVPVMRWLGARLHLGFPKHPPTRTP